MSKCNIMAEEFRFMPLGLVSWEPFGSAHGLLGRSINAGVHACGQSGGVTQRCHIAQMGNGDTECRLRHTPEAHGGCGGYWKIQGVEFCLVRRRLAFACSLKPDQWPCGGCRTCWGCRWKCHWKDGHHSFLCRNL